MPKSRTSISRTAFLIVAVIAGLVVWNQRNQQKIIRDMRAQIKKELKIEQVPVIEQMVKDEVRRVYDEKFAKHASSGMLLSRADQSVDEGETLDEAIHRIVWEVYAAEVEARKASGEAGIASDSALDAQVAGAGIDPDTAIQGGFIKKPALEPAYRLAKAAGGETTESSDEMAVDAGEGVERPESIERTLQQKGSVLLPKGKRIFEPSFTYAHFSTNRINIQGVTILDVFTIGPVSTQKIQRDMFIQTFGFKYGLADNLQGDLRIPFRYEFDRISNSDQTAEETRSKGGLGDIDVSVSRQIGWEEGWKPDLIASVGVKSNTGEPIYNRSIGLGTGHWAVRGSLVAAKSSDPAVVFGSLNYTHSFKEDYENYGEIQPGDTVGYSIGMAIALSYQTAVNFSFDQSITQKMKRGGEDVVGSFVNSANFKAGVNWALSERASVDVSTGIGLTEDSPDLTVEVRIPVYF